MSTSVSKAKGPLDPGEGLVGGDDVVFEARPGGHPTVTDDADMGGAEALLDLLHPRGDGRRVAGVAGEDLDRDRRDAGGGEQAADDLEPTAHRALDLGLAHPEPGHRVAEVVGVAPRAPEHLEHPRTSPSEVRGASPPDTAESAATFSSGQRERCASARFFTLPPSRKLSRNGTAGGDPRFGAHPRHVHDGCNIRCAPLSPALWRPLSDGDRHFTLAKRGHSQDMRPQLTRVGGL